MTVVFAVMALVASSKPERGSLEFWQVDQIARRHGFTPESETIACGIGTTQVTKYQLSKAEFDLSKFREELLDVHPGLKSTLTPRHLAMSGAIEPEGSEFVLNLSQTGSSYTWNLTAEFEFVPTYDVGFVSWYDGILGRFLP